MNINEKLLKSIGDSLNNNGIDIELSDNFKEDFFTINDEVERDNIRTYIQAKYLDSHMFLYTFANMLKNNEIDIIFNECATEHHISYLNKLSEGF